MAKIVCADTNCDPHRVVEDAQLTYPMTNESYPVGVGSERRVRGRIVSGSVEFACGRDLTWVQRAWLENHPHIVSFEVEDVVDQYVRVAVAGWR